MDKEGGNYMKLGQTIVNIRKERQMTQEEFSKLFNVTRQTVSNWEKEKSYPDLQTLVKISDEFKISLDTMLKEDKQMVKKMNKDIHYGKHLKIAVLCCISMLLIASITWAFIWNNAKNTTEGKFDSGIKSNGFVYSEQLGYYTKKVIDDTYYTLPNQKMPDYFEFTTDFYAKFLDCYTEENGNSLWIRWNDEHNKKNQNFEIYLLEDNKSIKSTLTPKQTQELMDKNSQISDLIEDGNLIYDSVYE